MSFRTRLQNGSMSNQILGAGYGQASFPGTGTGDCGKSRKFSARDWFIEPFIGFWSAQYQMACKPITSAVQRVAVIRHISQWLATPKTVGLDGLKNLRDAMAKHIVSEGIHYLAKTCTSNHIANAAHVRF
jgi:hypothetical protein